jgi:hypothetical protein
MSKVRGIRNNFLFIDFGILSIIKIRSAIDF